MPSKLQGATSQKAAIFKLVKTLKLTFNFLHENTNRKESIEIATSLMANCIHVNVSSDHNEKLNDLLHTLLEMDILYYLRTDLSSDHSSDQ
jgi:hypothetical protein